VPGTIVRRGHWSVEQRGTVPAAPLLREQWQQSCSKEPS
jgi:hypothetical protein